MQTLQTTSLRVVDNQLFILDQQALPQEKRWLPADSVALLVEHIHALRVRGAPLIGLSASLLLALLAEKGRTVTCWPSRWRPCVLRARRRST
jgi:methylthioribose-1-phosphate isomerase